MPKVNIFTIADKVNKLINELEDEKQRRKLGIALDFFLKKYEDKNKAQLEYENASEELTILSQMFEEKQNAG
jgi:hypothetical protein